MKKIKIFFSFIILFSQFNFSQDRTIYGSVNDSLGLPLPGVNILIEGTKKAAKTNFDGCYSIKVNPGQFLVFSFVGMNSQRISADQNEIDVTLHQSHSVLYDFRSS